MTAPADAAQRLRAYLNATPGHGNLGATVEYGPEFTAANGRPAGVYALDRADLQAVLDASLARGAERTARERGDVLAKAVQLVANQLAMAGLHDHAQELCFAIDEYEESTP